MAQPAQRQPQILLVDNDLQRGEIRCLLLRGHGLGAACVSGFDQARSACRAGKYDLLLVDAEHDVEAALEFCDELKKSDPQLLVALISQQHIWVPPDPCPDDVIPAEHDPRRFVRRVKELLERGTKAAPA